MAPTYKVERELNSQPMFLVLDRAEAKRLMTAFLRILSPVERMERPALEQALVDAELATPAQAAALLNTLKGRALSLGFANWAWKQGEPIRHYLLPEGRDYLAEIERMAQ